MLGGSAAFDVAAEEFVPAAGGHQAKIALLLQGGSDWEKYVPGYTEPWIRRGVAHHHVIVPNETRAWDIDQVAVKLGEATGIFIGGGHTPTYRHLYATEPLRSVIRERYRAGIPVAGVSAGAFIALAAIYLVAMVFMLA